MESQGGCHEDRAGSRVRARTPGQSGILEEVRFETLPIIHTVLSERLTATRNVFGNHTPTLYGIWDVRYLYRTDR